MIDFSRIGRWQLMARVRGMALVGVLLASGIFSMLSDANAAPKTLVVTIENMRFSPDALTVQRGDRVVWINKDLFAHTATALTKAFDSRNIEPNTSWTYVASKTGEFAYVCALHPTMKARLTVL